MFSTEVEYLGFDGCVQNEAISIKGPSNSRVAHSFVCQIRTLIFGLASFYRKFIRFFSEIAAPLTDLTKKGGAEVWSPEVCGAKEEEASRKLMTAMIISPVLQLPDFDREFIVTTNASEVSLGAIL